MKFDWHDEKAKSVWLDRQIDFKDMIQIFLGNRVEYRTDKNGEERYTTIGYWNNRFYAVVYTIRGDVIWIITARRAWKNEERKYLQIYS